MTPSATALKIAEAIYQSLTPEIHSIPGARLFVPDAAAIIDAGLAEAKKALRDCIDSMQLSADLMMQRDGCIEGGSALTLEEAKAALAKLV